MKHLNILILSLLLVVPFFLSGEDIQVDKTHSLIGSEIKITRLTYDPPGNRSHSIFPCIAEFEDDGVKKIMYCWSEETGLKNIYHCIKENNPDAQWSSPARASFTAVNSKSPYITVDPKKPDIVHMVWADGETRRTKEIYHSRYFNKKWQGMTKLISHANNDSFPVVTVLDNGTLNAAWEFMMPNPVTKEFDNTFLRSCNTWTTDDEQTVWDSKGHTVTTNTNHHATHIDIASRGLRTFAVWQEGTSGQRVVKFAEKIQKEGEDDHWSWPIRISTERHSFWPKITVDSHDNLHVMWGELRGKYGYNSRIFGKWTGPTNLNHGSANREFFDIKADDSDMLHAVFRGDQVDIYYSAKSANDLRGWPKEEKVSNGRECSHSFIMCCSKGYAHIAWGDIPQGASHTRDVWYGTFKRAVDTISNYPKADFTMSVDNETIVKGTTVQFDASPSTSQGGEISSYHWNFGDCYDDNNYSEKKQISHTFPKEGEYTVTLSTVDNVKQLIGNKSVTMNVISGPMPPLSPAITTYLYRGFLYRDWINKIEWQANPLNTDLGFTSVSYRVYKRVKGSDGEWTPVTDVSATSYIDSGYTTQEEAMNFQYGVSVVTGELESTIEPAAVAG